MTENTENGREKKMQLTPELSECLKSLGWEVQEREMHANILLDAGSASLVVDLTRSTTGSFEWGDFDGVDVANRHALGWYGVLTVDFEAETARFFAYLHQSSGQEGDEEVPISDVIGGQDDGDVEVYVEVEDVGEPPVEALIEDHRGQIDLCRVTRDWQCALFRFVEGEHLIRTTAGYEPTPAPYVTRFYPVDEGVAQTLLGICEPYAALSAMEEEVQRQREED